MKRTFAVVMAFALTVAGAQAASAKDHDNGRQDNGHYDNGRYDDGRRGNNPHDNGRHDNGLHRGWHKGGRIAQEDWRRGQRIDYRTYHLRQPPRGYEWREVDGNYVLAAVAGGIIASLIIGSH